MNKDKYLIMFDIEGFAAGNNFSTWPFHITLVPYFSIEDISYDELVNVIKNIAGNYGLVDFMSGDDAMFGPKKDITVTLVKDEDKKILNLHKILVQKLLDIGCVFDDMSFCFDNFKPHVSYKESMPVSKTKRKLNKISIVKRPSNSCDYNKIITDVIYLNKLKSESDIKILIENDFEMMRVLKIISDLKLPDWIIGGGWLRNKIWDVISDNQENRSADIDVCYFDAENIDPDVDWKIDEELKSKFPELDIQVRNQARMHYLNGFEPCSNTKESMSRWIETATCVGAKIEGNNVVLQLIYGTDDLLNIIARPTKYFQGDKIKIFRHRVESKGWKQRWPGLKVFEK